ncbi:TPM domain-containing protein [Hoyosella altamirensis]|uniref:Tetratricopeptide (TPR) repeat protein n=1 Tax=Hoyosella altamirensis TaxID=616997 RepID=A0A839RS92_9ACTN|nr:TPM domain-containing protein [Hoyosella altamirensis]MBB3038996.1 tetratricopeptide (TPR) repeat protein [Hoyosella altamirensis]
MGRRPGRTAFAAVMFMLAALFLGVPATSVAEPPLRLDDRIVDNVGALSAGDMERIRPEFDELYDDRRIRLWVVYTDTFMGFDGQTWTDATSAISGFGDNDVLLAVAVTDRQYFLNLPDSMTAISGSEERAILRDDIEPALSDDLWADAAIGAANGLARAAAPSTSSPVPVLIVLGGIAGFIVFLVVRSKRRATRIHARNVASLDSIDLTDRAALAQVPASALDTKSKAMLVETDDAIRTSEEELARARDEFGDSSVSQFTQALTSAKRALGRAFEIRQRLDDAIPETPPQRHQMLVDLIATCATADRDLDAQVEAFDAKRNLLISAPERLDSLTQDVVAVTVRIPEAERALESLRAQFAPSVLGAIEKNPSLAKDHVTLAEETISEARRALSRGDSANVIASLRAAEAAVSQARELVEGVAHAETDIRSAITRLPAAMADLEKDIERARQLANAGGSELNAARAAAEEALVKARDARESDPLGSFHHIVEADAALDELLARAQEASEREQHARRTLANDLSAADAHITAARDFISTRRGAIGAEPRTRLSEAERHAGYARHIATSDPVTALEHARAAVKLAQQALSYARSEVSSWESQQRTNFANVGQTGGGPGSMTNVVVGGMLGGILMDAMRSGSGSRHRSSGFGTTRRGSTGGFSTGRSSSARRSSTVRSRSFGGPRSSGRRGGGGRF